MKLCIPYRHYVTFMCVAAVQILVGTRYIFILVVTHTNADHTKTADSGGEDKDSPTIFSHCPTTNTSRDYSTDFPDDVIFLFHSIVYAGILIGLFLSTYLSSWISPHRELAVLGAVASVLSLISPLTLRSGSNEANIVLRLLQGLSLSTFRPHVLTLASKWALPKEKCTVTSILLISSASSPTTAYFLSGLMLCFVSWDSAFYIYGGLGLVWTACWTLTYYSDPEKCPFLSKNEVEQFGYSSFDSRESSQLQGTSIPWKHIFTSKPVLVLWFCFFTKSFGYSLMQDLQPQFMSDTFDMKAADIGVLLAGELVVSSSTVLLTGIVADRVIASGKFSKTRVFKSIQFITGLMEAFFFVLVVSFLNSWKYSYLFLTLSACMESASTMIQRQNGVIISRHFAGTVNTIITTGTAGGGFNTLIASLSHGDEGTSARWHTLFLLCTALSVISTIFYVLFASAESPEWDKLAQNGSELSMNRPQHEKSSLVQKNGYGVDGSPNLPSNSDR